MRTSQVRDLDGGSTHLRRSTLRWATALMLMATTTPAFARQSSCGHAQPATATTVRPQAHSGSGGRATSEATPESGPLAVGRDGSAEPVAQQVERRDRRPVWGLAAAGEAVFQGLACATCHRVDGRGAGPALHGIFGRSVVLDDGRVLTADDRYLRESIVDPAAKVVSGNRPVMPSFQWALTGEQVSALVAYIESLAAPAPPQGQKR